jgi:hypothetical protein
LGRVAEVQTWGLPSALGYCTAVLDSCEVCAS